MIISALALAFATIPSGAAPVQDVDVRRAIHPVARLAGGKNPRKWVEKVQGVQYDGEYSPPSGRMAEPEPSATVPVRYLPKYVREIPVIVKPAPIYVDEATVVQQNQERAQARAQQQEQQVPGQQFGGQGGGYASGGVPLTSAPVGAIPGPLPSAGSATGSTAIATYGALPNATAVPTQGGSEQDD